MTLLPSGRPERLRTAVASLAVVGGAAGLLAALNRALLLDDLPPTLPGANHNWRWRGWRVRYTTLGAGPPLVLVHGIHAAASAFEMRGIFEPLARDHTVYAIDLLGFGKSERPATSYTADLYVDLLSDFLTTALQQSAVVLASSLSASYAAAAARRQPPLCRGLILVSPTGTTDFGGPARAAGRLAAGCVLRSPLIGTAAFNALVSRASIRTYLARAYADGHHVDEQLVGQNWATAHQPGARFAPAAFVAGRLDHPLWRAGPPIAAPILVLRGSGARLGHGAPDAELRRLGPSVTIQTLEGTGLVPHDEAPDRSVQAIDDWLAGLR